MSKHRNRPFAAFGRAVLAFGVLGLTAAFAGAPPSARGADPRFAPGFGHTRDAQLQPTTLGIPPVLPLADGWWQRVTDPVWTLLSSRRAMMQFGAVGMIIALAAIWWRRT
jgi:hypothetical protein